jgi:uncharacterized protein YbcV (DUF1398 family)
MLFPEPKDYSKYNSTMGMKTKVFGPALWDYLFVSILGAFPMTIDPNDPEHIEIQSHFKTSIMSLCYTLPCVFCRRSFKQFTSELNIDDYLSGRINMVYYIYLLKDKVNRKLLNQELKCLVQEFKKLGNTDEFLEYANKTLVTEVTPPFDQVLEKYEAYRAVCDKKVKKCL